jgi:hypothetical protein
MPSIGQTDVEAPTRAVNELSQTLLTVAVFVVLAGLLVWAYRMGRARGTVTPVVMVFAIAVGTLNEAAWNTLFHLYWYVPGQWTLWTSFGIPQPVWMSGMYTAIYGLPALWAWQQADAGRLTRQVVGRLLVASVLVIGVLEMAVIAGGVYSYYGPTPFAVDLGDGKYPLYCAVMEGAFITVFAIVMARLGPALKRWGALLTLPVFSMLFCAVFFGGGMPILVVINGNDVPDAVLYGGAIAGVALTLTMVWLTTFLLPSTDGSRSQLEARLGLWALRAAPAADLTTSSTLIKENA